MQTIGIYGGTFDPIHRGHLHVINHVLTHELVDYLLVIPSGEPWLREHQPLAGGADRVAMCALAISELPQDIKNRIDVLIVERPDQVPGKGIDIQALPISATQVRAEIVGSANSVAIPPIVATYIKEHGLYGSK